MKEDLCMVRVKKEEIVIAKRGGLRQAIVKSSLIVKSRLFNDVHMRRLKYERLMIDFVHRRLHFIHLIFVACMPRMADWGMLIIGVPNSDPKTPPLLIVKVPPVISSRARAPSFA